MMWTEVTANNFCASVRDGTHDSPKPVEKGRYLITSRHIIGGKIDLSNAYLISNDDFDAINKRSKVDRWDVLISMIGTVGEPCLVKDEPEFAIKNIGLFKTKNELDGRWLYYYLTSPRAQTLIRQHSRGTTQAYVPLGALREFPIRMPKDREVMRAITNILGGLDDKIDLNRRINQTLETMAQAIFKSWFVDFDPVKAKIAAIEQGEDPLRAAMCAISGKTDTELDQMPREHHNQLAATAALFSDAMEESELWEIPKGWGIKSVSNIARFATGKVEVPSLTVENYISTENMLENRGGISHASSLPVVATVPTFESGNVLVSNIRPYFKKIWLARFDGGRSNDVLCFEAKEDGCQEFLYNLLYQDIFFEFMMRTSKGAKMPRGDKEAIAGWKFPCAPLELRKAFSKKVRTFYSYIESINLESKQLSELRDTLLPKLLSGDLSVADSEMKRVGR
ncbi:restriction endonuclease subunit S [Castellaniella ginsengisoli]|uniref:Restriction endonuclease subunit S n=3 Tax=Castellaniella ginsengisoli TaxID=546114 RepID=A0AB39DKJ4_9BURK